MLVLTSLLVLLLLATVYEYRQTKAREAAGAKWKAEEILWLRTSLRIVRAMTDDHTCDLCHRVTAVRELVMLSDDAALCCLGCATILRYQRTAA